MIFLFAESNTLKNIKIIQRTMLLIQALKQKIWNKIKVNLILIIQMYLIY